MNSRISNENQGSGTMLAVSAVMFILTFSAFSSIGFVPAYVDGVYSNSPAVEQDISVEQTAGYASVALADLPQLGTSILERSGVTKQSAPSVEPERIVIHSIGVDLPILNPESTDVTALDEALLSGSVRYPLSSKLNEDGNIFIFGHSSNVAIVKNQMYKAFNRLSELRAGDTIKIVGGGDAHIYRVKEVRRTDVDEELIDLSPTRGRVLTLSTCDSFTGKTSRFVIEADFIGSYKDE